MSQPNEHWFCACCGELFDPQNVLRRQYGTFFYCPGCISDVIERNAEDELLAWPPQIDEDIIHLTPDLEAVLRPVAVQAYRNIPVWRTIGAHARIWCQRPILNQDQAEKPCNGFIGARATFAEGQAHQWQNCSACELQTCRACERSQSNEPLAAADSICTMSRMLQAHNAHFAGGDRGKEFQLCPACGTPGNQDEGCNSMTCACGIIYCYICGTNQMGNNDTHWRSPLEGGCPRYKHPHNPEAVWDDSSTDREDYDGRSFEELSPRWSRYLADATLMAEADSAIRLRGEDIPGVDGTDADERSRLKSIILSSRHLLAMLHNGFLAEVEDLSREARLIRFVHHALLFTQDRNRGNDANTNRLPGGRELYTRLAAAIARRRYQHGALKGVQKARAKQLDVLGELIEDEIEYGHPGDYLLSLDPGSEVQRDGLFAVSMLLPMDEIIQYLKKQTEDNARYDSIRFDRRDSVDVNDQLAAMERSSAAYGTRGDSVAAFQQRHPHQRAIGDLIKFFSDDLFSNLDDDLLAARNACQTSQQAESCGGHWWTSEISSVISGLAAKNASHDLRALGVSLEYMLRAFTIIKSPGFQNGPGLGALSQSSIETLQGIINEGPDRGKGKELRPIYHTRWEGLGFLAEHSGRRLVWPSDEGVDPVDYDNVPITLLSGQPLEDQLIFRDIQFNLGEIRDAHAEDSSNPPLDDENKLVWKMLPHIRRLIGRLCNTGVHTMDQNAANCRKSYNLLSEHYFLFRTGESNLGRPDDQGRVRQASQAAREFISFYGRPFSTTLFKMLSLTTCALDDEGAATLSPLTNPDRGEEMDRRDQRLDRLREAEGMDSNRAQDDFVFLGRLQRILGADWTSLWNTPNTQTTTRAALRFRKHLIDLMVLVEAVMDNPKPGFQLPNPEYEDVRDFHTKFTPVGNIRTGLGRLYRLTVIFDTLKENTEYQVKARAEGKKRLLTAVGRPKQGAPPLTDYQYIEELSACFERLHGTFILTRGEENDVSRDAVEADEVLIDIVENVHGIMLRERSTEDYVYDAETLLTDLTAHDLHNTAMGDLEVTMPRLYGIAQTMITGTYHLVESLSPEIRSDGNQSTSSTPTPSPIPTSTAD